MAQDREIWFVRRRFVGYIPANWKGSVLTVAFFVIFYLFFIGAGVLGLMPKYEGWLFLGFFCFVWLPFFCVTVSHMDNR